MEKLLSVAGVILNSSGDILLHQREEGVWEVFATYVQPGERLVEALDRRVKEYSGLTGVNFEFTGRYYDDPNRHPGRHCIPFLFKGVCDTTEIDSSSRWFKKEEVRELELALDNKQMLVDIQAI
ncbi:MAG: hypothetical protein COU06_01610 [Candidatus Harrisonbacteria bacterium CG10_big_fil_rev_8_21_14_0_10_38_8]|uniref:Nudix hydrolase domain-containing protein n=1 Tax=Candidatus Harrisonbacteria bacterium CG10_big_fil_rev_8_21_14_0_10_38_8 TaxID=1974582 RepID=A0A2M6WK38_9BACT|nr:MAG: hypothetical protein COU06_01610 [Candidatus Harrisonbacteria bacterium CG10_big_fil_rev_8_21_14_0_10_38_8]